MPKPKEQSPATAALTFESALVRLEQVVRELESGDRTLEESLRLFQEGVGLARLCGQRLDEAEAKVEKLLDMQADEPRTVPFAAGDAQ